MTAVLFPAGVLGLAITMLVSHTRTWHSVRIRPLDAIDRTYRHEQFRRRIQASSLLALLGPAIFVGQQVIPEQSPRLFMTLWLAVLVASCWIVCLALLDAVASGRHFHRLSITRRADRTRLRQELDDLVAQARARKANPPETPLVDGTDRQS